MASQESTLTEDKVQTAIELNTDAVADDTDSKPIQTNDEKEQETTEKERARYDSIYDSVTAIDPEKPKIWRIPTQEEREPVDKCFNNDVSIRLARWAFIAICPIILLAIETNVEEIELTILLAIAIEFMYILYFSIVASLFYSGSRRSKDRSLFRIWTRAEKVPGWAEMTIATHQQLYRFEAIQSISEFSAVEGGVPSFMLVNLGTFTWAIVAMHYASELECDSSIFVWDIADVVEIIGVLGLVMIGTFELDPYNPPMKAFHYLGALAGCGTIGGFFIQQISLTENPKFGYSLIWLPVVIAVTAITCFILWQYSNKVTDKYQEEIREKYKGKKLETKELEEIRDRITSLSLKNVVTEGMFLFMGATSLALWMAFYHQDCDRGCAGPLS